MSRYEYAKEWRKKNPERYRAQHKKDARKLRLKRHGLTEEDYNELFSKQNGMCAICMRVPSRRLDIDHDHQTGRVRGLLCNPCNQALGLLQDNPLIIKAALQYIGGVS